MVTISESRSWPRKNCLIPASYASSASDATIACYVIDISGGGLRLRLNEEHDWPPSGSVGLNLHGLSVILKANVRWHKGDIAGLEFAMPLEKETEKAVFSFINAP